ncbi:MAG: hypothetical protein AAB472_03590 [Patescibacteria group bacterium]
MRYVTLLLGFLLLAPQAHAARIFQTGAELNSTTAGMEVTSVDGTGASVSSTNVRSGNYVWRSNNSGNTSGITQRLSGNDVFTPGYLRVYFYFATLPSVKQRIMQFNTAANLLSARVDIYTDGKLVLMNSSSVAIGTSTLALQTNRWYRLELKDDPTLNPGKLELRVDGVTVVKGDSDSQAGWARVRVGPNLNNSVTDVYYDDIAVNTSSGTSQNSWPGDGKLVLLSPNAAGDSNQWLDTVGGAGTTNNYTLVDEIPPNNATDFVNSGTLNDTDWYGISPMSAVRRINVVSVHGRLTNNTADATTAAKWQIQKISGGTVSQGTAVIPNSTTWCTDGNSTTIWQNILTLYNDPDGQPWTWQTLQTAQIGPKITASNANRIQVSSMWVYVDYSDLSSGVYIQTKGLFQLLKGLFVIL